MRQIRGRKGRRSGDFGWRNGGIVIGALALGLWGCGQAILMRTTVSRATESNAPITVSDNSGTLGNVEDSNALRVPILPLDPPPKDMVKNLLEQEIRRSQEQWREVYESVDTPEKSVAYQERLKAQFVAAIGGLPGPISEDPHVIAERSPLNARITGTLERTGVDDAGQTYRYRVEKVLFESQPGLYVTAAIFLPDETVYPAPWPGVVVPCGHSSEGKAMVGYQAGCALAAIHGIAAIIFDPIDQGERHQLLEEDGTPQLIGTSAHNLVGSDSIPLGRNTARFEIWDGIRTIDYLQSRDDIRSDQIGCMGNSGGGTQTAYLMALDPRIQVAAPACYICSLYGLCCDKEGPQDAEQNIAGQLAFGMDHVDYCLMRSPKPTLMGTATQDFFPITMAWQSFRDAKRWYSRFGYGDRMELVEVPGPHGWSRPLREASVRWMLRWLAQRDEEITEPDSLEKSVLSQKEIQCTPDGETLRLDHARSVYALNAEYAAELAKERRERWDATPRAENLERVRKILGVRPIAEIPEPNLVKEDTVQEDGRTIRRILFQREDGATIPTLLFSKRLPERDSIGSGSTEGETVEGSTKPPVILLCDQGKTSVIEKVRKEFPDTIVLVPDLRGLGETQQSGQTYFQPSLHGGDGQDFYRAYLLGKNYVGMRTEDVLALTTWLGRECSWSGQVVLRADGPLCRTVGLHAVAISDGRLCADADEWVTGWDGEPQDRAVLTNLVPGAMTVYDLRMLRETF